MSAQESERESERGRVPVLRLRRLPHLAQGNGENPALFLHGMVGVGAEIHDNLMDLGGIRQHRPLGVDIVLDLDGGGDGGAQHLQCLLGYQRDL